MKKFPSIGKLSDVVHWAKKHVGQHPQLIHTVEYIGTVKLHGTNGGVRVQNGIVTAQSRSRVLTEDTDNFDFCRFVKKEEALLRTLAAMICQSQDVTLFGEYIGPGIQRNVALANLPSRKFIIFGAYDHVNDKHIVRPNLENLRPRSLGYSGDLRTSISFSSDVPTYSLSINLFDPVSVQEAFETAMRLTQEVEDSCPWGDKLNTPGTGEGIVWVPTTSLTSDESKLWFKTKGQKHQVVKDPREKITADPMVASAVCEFVEYAVTEPRLLQGIQAIKEELACDDLSMRNIGQFLKWVCKDVHKECEVEIEASNLCWGEISRGVTKKAKEFFIRKLQLDN